MNIKKILKQLPPGVAEEMEAMDEARLRNCIVESEQNIRVATEEMEGNADFQATKEAYRNAAAPLRDAKKAQQARIAYALLLLESKGRI